MQIVCRDDGDVWFEHAHGRACGVTRERVFFLMTLRVEDVHQNCGIGSDILRAVARWCADEGIRRVDVDDMSCRFRKENNIYRRAGFVYRHVHGPEMYASPRNMIECLKRN